MDDHDKSLKRKRLLSDPGDEHDLDTAEVCPPSKLAEEASPLCYGTILDATIRVRQWPDAGNDSGEPLSFDRHPVVAQGLAYGLTSHDTVFAVFNKTSSQYMHHLSEIEGVHLEGLINHGRFLESRAKGETTVKVGVNVYGNRAGATKAGEVLSSFGVYLQQPTSEMEHVTYYNPHFLHVEGLLGLGPVQETPRFEMDTQVNAADRGLGSQSPATPVPEQGDNATEISNVLSSLSHHAILSKKAGAMALKSQLKDYQMEALDFISRRESGKLPPELTLWAEAEDEHGEQIYEHTIIGARRPHRSDTKGGILADEMGVGKTIVALATIAASLDRASDFATRGPEDGTFDSERRRSKATLVIAPSSLLIDSWVDEIRKHIYPGHMTFYKYHGRQRQQDANLLFERDVVFSTYATLASEPDRGLGILNSVEWFRIVLDEAHEIRNTTTKQFHVVFNLAAQHRWCLTGTPIQNSVEDLGALISFLRVPMLEKPSTFRRYLLSQARQGTRNSFKNLRLLLNSICLRRTKDVAGLSDPILQTRVLSLTSTERRDYVELLDQLRRHVDMDVSGHTTRGSSTRMLQGILKLRLFCNNGFMGRGASRMPFDADEVLSCLQQTGQASCVLCSRTIYSISRVPDTDGGCPLEPCSHLACRDCAVGLSSKKQCPRCAEGDSGSSIQGILHSMKEFEEQDTSAPGLAGPSQGPVYPSKLRAFVEDIQAQVAVKSIVFSFWKTTLDLVSQLLEAQGLGCFMIHGSLPLSQRRQILDRFRSTDDAHILLMTLGTGAVGLNLAVASRIYLLEPQWNPQLEQQAFGRAQRLGQTEQVTIVRYIMRDTVEDSNVWPRQAKKLRDATRGFEKSGGKTGKGHEQDLRDVFIHATPAAVRKEGMPSISELCSQE
ncbi:hypothetical protein KVR01_013761 [Diaporthe batatas]|uniref:uncharacterized protein n=1 Tax=Diaporthe batatas TaxID=748121 RepID=UPI001D0440B0|nr:uncharacterized protein KVR01_013761 [Diaporthe batatas]KAG8156420.1 hypothetical protein KVR01_013761 [Diaporthe batatas]